MHLAQPLADHSSCQSRVELVRLGGSLSGITNGAHQRGIDEGRCVFGMLVGQGLPVGGRRVVVGAQKFDDEPLGVASIRCSHSIAPLSFSIAWSRYFRAVGTEQSSSSATFAHSYLGSTD